jgi:Acyl-CoA synthetases (AMP-forming)/AMP-acid ligases II
VPTSFLFLQRHSSVLKRNFTSLRLWLQAGGHLSSSVVNAFREAHPQADFAVMYGQTEATSRIATFIVDGEYPRGCVGYPMESLQVEIRSEDGSIKGSGQAGHIWVRGASVCAGYFGDPEREVNKFVGGWLNTGDIGYLLEDGRLCITGRADGFIKIRGRRIEALEVEDLIWHEFGLRSCACAIPDSSSGEAIGLLLESNDHRDMGQSPGPSGHVQVTPSYDAKEGENEDAYWAKRVRNVLPSHWDLGQVISGKLPLTSSGKINRRACSELLVKASEAACR